MWHLQLSYTGQQPSQKSHRLWSLYKLISFKIESERTLKNFALREKPLTYLLFGKVPEVQKSAQIINFSSKKPYNSFISPKLHQMFFYDSSHQSVLILLVWVLQTRVYLQTTKR